MIRNPVPFILLLGIASTHALAATAQDQASDLLAGYSSDEADGSLPGAPSHHKARSHHAARTPGVAVAATAGGNDLLDGDMPAGAPALLAAPRLPRTVAPRQAASIAYAPVPATTAPINAGPIGTTPLAVSPGVTTRVATSPTAPTATTPEFPSPGISTPTPTPMPMAPMPMAPRPAPVPMTTPMSPVLPRRPVPPTETRTTMPPAGTATQVAAPRVIGGVNALALDAGQGRVIQLGATAASVFAADPKVAEVRPASANSLFIFGVAPGRTTVAALDAAGSPVAQYDVIVQPSSFGAIAARTAVKRLIPGSDIRVDTEATGLAVSGTVATPADAARAMDIVRGYTPAGETTINNLSVTASLQVNLRVRIAEMSRNLTRDLGVNWSSMAQLGSSAAIGVATANPLIGAAATGITASLSGAFNIKSHENTVNINKLIDALSQDQLIHVLAEPNLTAISGQQASFLVGGEFPIPVAQQNNTTTVEFKQFGVSLAFVPTVMSDGHINMKVRPEVSALSTQGAIQLSASNSSIAIPALTVRRAETTVELGSGQSFAIAGLLQDNVSLTSNGTPILGDLPILGALFRSDNFQRNETELVIIVTPYIVRPVTDVATLHVPGETFTPPNDFERMLLLRQTSRQTGAPATASRIPGSAGFVVQ